MGISVWSILNHQELEEDGPYFHRMGAYHFGVTLFLTAKFGGKNNQENRRRKKKRPCFLPFRRVRLWIPLLFFLTHGQMGAPGPRKCSSQWIDFSKLWAPLKGSRSEPKAGNRIRGMRWWLPGIWLLSLSAFLGSFSIQATKS